MSVTVLKRTKALSVNPLKTSQPSGAALAFLGLNRSMPLFHGSQGCTAFAKVLFVRHFREPIPLQTTAMDQISTVMGADDSVVEALTTIAGKSRPDVIGLLTTGLSETQGTDIQRAVKLFREAKPEFIDIAVVPVNTPDFTGSLESGFAAAVEAMVQTLVPRAEEAGTVPGRRRRQVNVLVGAHLTPGDLEALKELIEAFDLRPLLIPDIAGSLDGHLTPDDFSPVTVGGTPVAELALAGDSIATLAVGASVEKAADRLGERTGVPDFRFPHLYGLDAVDAFVHRLSLLAERPVPARIERQRAQLQDAMVDTHFMLGQVRVAVAAEPDHLSAVSDLLAGMGAEIVAAVTTGRSPALEQLPVASVQIGDLEDLETLAHKQNAELLIGNSHLAQSAERLGLPLLRCGFPLYDQVGAYQRTWIGYRGTRQALFDLANLMMHAGGHDIHPYRSRYAQKLDRVVGRADQAKP